MQLVGFLILFVLRQFSQTTLIIDQMLLISAILFIFAFVLTNPNMKRSGVVKFPTFSNDSQKSNVIARMSIAAFVALFFLTISVQTIANVDRSRSMFMFEWIGCAPNSSQLSSIEASIIEKFGTESLIAFRQRVGEQQTRGLVQRNSSEISLTESGLILFEIEKFINSVFKLTGWNKNLLWDEKNCSF
jgi:hypothetical protein